MSETSRANRASGVSWQNLPPLARYWVIAFVVLAIAGLVTPFIVMGQSNADRDIRSTLYFFSMKPVVIGEGSQVIHVSSKRWNMDSQVTIDASADCVNVYGMSFDTALPAQTQITEKYDSSNNGRTHFPLSVTPGTVASGPSEADSTCMISISDGEYTISRALRQIAASDKLVFNLSEAPSLSATDYRILWEDQGHPPGIWFHHNPTNIRSISRAHRKADGKDTYTARSVYSHFNRSHPESVYAGGVPSSWIAAGLWRTRT